jgi:hypothetical protein
MGRAGQAGRPTRADEHWTTLDVVHWNDEPGVRLFGTELEWRVGGQRGWMRDALFVHWDDEGGIQLEVRSFIVLRFHTRGCDTSGA